MKLRNLTKRLLAFAMAASLAASLIPASTAEAANTYTVNLSKTYQTIQGFGGMNHPVWTSDLTSSQINTAFGTGANDLGLNILRIHVDENKSNWSKELSTAKAAIAKGAIVFATPWNPPSSMTETYYKNGKQTKRLKTSSYAAYASYLNEFVSYMKNNGVDLYAISIQNEPDYGYEWTWWEPDEIYNFTKNYAGKINCRVISAESFSYNKTYYDKILNDSSALNNVDIIGTHFYGTLESQMAYSLYNQKASNKPLWMTEVYVPNSTDDADKWPGALDVATNISSAMSNNFSAYVWWYIRRSYSLLKENGSISKRGYCMAQFSKFVKKGYKRVDTTAKPDSNVYVSAFTGDNKAVVVVTNKNNSQLNKNITITGGTSTNCTRYRTSSSENLAVTSNIKVSNNTLNVNLPAYSVSTFVFDLGSGSSSSSSSSSSSGSSSSSSSGSSSSTQTSSANVNNNTTATIPDGWYYLKNTNSQKYLSVEGNKAAAGTNVCINTGSGVDGQKWKVTNTSDGYITLTSGLGSFMLDVSNGSADDGANIGIYHGYSGDAQKFVVKNTGTNGVYTIATKSSNQVRYIDVYNHGKTDGTNVCQWLYYGNPNQQWQFEKVAESSTGTSSSGSSSSSSSTSSGSTNTGSNSGSTQAASTGAMALDYTINSWGSGYQVSFKVTNKTGAQVNTWTLKLKKSDINITSSWNINVTSSGDYYVITPVSWNSTIANGSSVEFGVQGSGSIGTTINYTLN